MTPRQGPPHVPAREEERSQSLAARCEQADLVPASTPIATA